MRFFKTGKVPYEVLIRNVFRYTGMKDPSVILGSSVGEDAALISFGDRVLVLTTDPITGTASDIGWLSVHINANDVACRGARPRWFLCDLLLPEKANVRMVDTIMRQVDRAAKELRIAVVGGHTEVTPGLARPIVIGFMMGLTRPRKFVKSGGARDGDSVIMTKSAGIEGTAVLATDFAKQLRAGVSRGLLARARGLRRQLSVVDDALTAMRSGGVHAMHDPTEGGLLQGIWELAHASNVGFLIHESRIPISPETERICSALNLNPLKLMSSGCLIISAHRRKTDRILRMLSSNGIPANVIGRITSLRNGRKLITTNGSVRNIRPSERDELYRVIESYQSQ